MLISKEHDIFMTSVVLGHQSSAMLYGIRRFIGITRLKKYILCVALFILVVGLVYLYSMNGYTINYYPYEKFLQLEDHDRLYRAWLQRLVAENKDAKMKSSKANQNGIFSLSLEDSSLLNFNKYDFEFLLNKPKLCDSSDVQYLFGVLSAPGNFEARQAIRNTWGSAINTHFIKLIFLLGIPSTNVTLSDEINNEDSTYHDIVQGNFNDSYEMLTLKTVMLLEWTVLHCGKAAFVIKVDDDVYVNIYNFISALHKHKHRRNAILGQIVINSKVVRTVNDKFYISKKVYAENYYPTYLGGPMYVMTGDSVPLLYRAALNSSFFKLEDVYITGICANKSGVKLIEEPSIVTEGLRYLDICKLNSQVSVHQASPFVIESLWTNYLLKNRDCVGFFRWLLQFISIF